MSLSLLLACIYKYLLYLARYDTVPDTLAINNSVTLQYDASLGPADMFNITDDTWPTLDDTRFVPLQAKGSAEADVSYELGAYFDTFDDGTNRAACELFLFERLKREHTDKKLVSV